MVQFAIFMREEFIGTYFFPKWSRSKLNRGSDYDREYYAKLLVDVFLSMRGLCSKRFERFNNLFRYNTCIMSVPSGRDIFSQSFLTIFRTECRSTTQQVELVQLRLKSTTRACSFARSRLRSLSLTARTIKHATVCNKHS